MCSGTTISNVPLLLSFFAFLKTYIHCHFQKNKNSQPAQPSHLLLTLLQKTCRRPSPTIISKLIINNREHYPESPSTLQHLPDGAFVGVGPRSEGIGNGVARDVLAGWEIEDEVSYLLEAGVESCEGIVWSEIEGGCSCRVLPTVEHFGCCWRGAASFYGCGGGIFSS